MGYHCFRGVLTPSTDVYLHAAPDKEGEAAACGAVTRGGGLELHDCPLRPAGVPSANRVTVHCNDGEFFVVHKTVLRPCIALTSAIRAAGPTGGTEVSVDVGCLVFDRALLFLEAMVRCRRHACLVAIALGSLSRPVAGAGAAAARVWHRAAGGVGGGGPDAGPARAGGGVRHAAGRVCRAPAGVQLRRNCAPQRRGRVPAHRGGHGAGRHPLAAGAPGRQHDHPGTGAEHELGALL